MKKTISIIILLISFFTFSQQQTRDVIYLQNGSIVKGVIIEMNPSKNIKIKTADGSLFVYSISDVIKMEKEEFVGQVKNQKTSSIVSQSAIDNFFLNYLSEKRPDLNFIGVSKKNGIKKEVFGQGIYKIEYELILETKQNIFINASQFGSAWSNRFVDDFSYSLKASGGYESALAGKKKMIEKGKRIVANGTLNFEETDNGWRATGFNNLNFKTVSSNYVTPQMAERNEKEKNSKIISYIEAGEWKISDIEESKFQPLYYKADYVPIFNNSTTKFQTKKTNTCNDCRNDNIQAINKTLKTSIQSMNRYNNSTDVVHLTSENSTNIVFDIKNIEFKHLGIKENGDNKGFLCTIKYDILINVLFKNPYDLEISDKRSSVATASLLRYYPDKKSAFNGALKRFQENVSSFIKKYEPYELDVVRVNLSKKGKVESIILKKPKLFSKIKKGDFLIFKKGDLSIKNNKYSLKSSVGKCKFKGNVSDTEISCQIKGSKNRKSFLKIKDDVSDYKAMSSF